MGLLADRFLPVVLLILVNVLFSGYAILSSYTFKHSTLSPVVFAFLRDAVACSCFAATLTVTAQRVPEAERGPLVPSREHAALFLLLGFLGASTAMYGVLSISLTSPTVYGVMTPLVPCITILASFALGIETFRVREVASWAKVLGIAVAVGSAASIVFFGTQEAAGGTAGAPGGYAYLLAQKSGVALYPLHAADAPLWLRHSLRGLSFVAARSSRSTSPRLPRAQQTGTSRQWVSVRCSFLGASRRI